MRAELSALQIAVFTAAQEATQNRRQRAGELLEDATSGFSTEARESVRGLIRGYGAMPLNGNRAKHDALQAFMDKLGDVSLGTTSELIGAISAIHKLFPPS